MPSRSWPSSPMPATGRPTSSTCRRMSARPPGSRRRCRPRPVSPRPGPRPLVCARRRNAGPGRSRSALGKRVRPSRPVPLTRPRRPRKPRTVKRPRSSPPRKRKDSASSRRPPPRHSLPTRQRRGTPSRCSPTPECRPTSSGVRPGATPMRPTAVCVTPRPRPHASARKRPMLTPSGAGSRHWTSRRTGNGPPATPRNCAAPRTRRSRPPRSGPLT